MPKINELQQISTREEAYTVTVPAVYDEETGEEIAPETTEERVRTVPVMAVVAREMTAEEVARMEAEGQQEGQESETPSEGSLETRVAAVEGRTDEIEGVVSAMLGGIADV